MVEANKPNPALEMARTLSLDKVEAELLGSGAQAPVENKPGSYERFMQMLGATGGRRPGA